MPTKKSPQQRSIELLREEGWWPEVCEQIHRTPKCVFRRDLLGFADIIAFPVDGRHRGTVLLVQVTSGSNHAARRTKIAEEPRAAYARMANVRIEIHSWRKNVLDDWIVRREDVS